MLSISLSKVNSRETKLSFPVVGKNQSVATRINYHNTQNKDNRSQYHTHVFLYADEQFYYLRGKRADPKRYKELMVFSFS